MIPSLVAALVALAGFFGPLTTAGDARMAGVGFALPVVALLLTLTPRLWATVLLVPVGLSGALFAVLALQGAGGEGAWGYWALLWGHLLVVCAAVGRVSLRGGEDSKRLRAALPPASVPFLFLLLWQGLVVGLGVPKGIFPSVTDVYRSLLATWPVLLRDAYVTFIKEVLLGFLIGFSAGFLAGVGIAFSRFLQRGFLPLAAAFGAVPIVGLAPVLGRAFGVDWQSKAAVVVIVTFFPVLLNIVQGLVSVDPLKLELLRAYAANARDVLFKLRLPNALPYLFNALKLAAVISVVSVIVAEFLIPGPPEGLGQRISLSARRGSFDVVFAAIFVSSLLSVTVYGLLSALERLTTSWHASFREDA